MRILFALPGLHRIERGAEIAFIAIASELARSGDEVTLIGSGVARRDTPYRFIPGRAIARERFERFWTMPFLRGETAWEELSFMPSLLRHFRPGQYDVTVTCSFPFTNLALRRASPGQTRPAHIFVTQNGDWPAFSQDAEYRLFDCDGLVCINPDYFERNSARYRSALIPNGVDTARFTPGPAQREAFQIPARGPIILMVSALIASKHVAEGIRAVAAIPDATLVVAGDGPLRTELHKLAGVLLPGRFVNIGVTPNEMPALYRSADVFLHLSRDESFGNVFIEALACGTPLVAYDLPRTRWILGEEAFYVASQEGEAITAQIEAALGENGQGRDRRSASARKYDWSSIADRYRSFFAEVVSERR